MHWNIFDKHYWLSFFSSCSTNVLSSDWKIIELTLSHHRVKYVSNCYHWTHQKIHVIKKICLKISLLATLVNNKYLHMKTVLCEKNIVCCLLYQFNILFIIRRWWWWFKLKIRIMVISNCLLICQVCHEKWHHIPNHYEQNVIVCGVNL